MTHRCDSCNKNFQTKEALQDHNRSKHTEQSKKKLLTSTRKKKIKVVMITIMFAVAIVGLISFFSSNIKTLPSKDMRGHMEASPSSHILKEPMSIAVHKHMLEHADGKEGGRGGVIINYNCDDFACEEDLVEQLEDFAQKYPIHVYVAPFPNMEAKIVLTKLDRQKVLDGYDYELIDNFIR